MQHLPAFNLRVSLSTFFQHTFFIRGSHKKKVQDGLQELGCIHSSAFILVWCFVKKIENDLVQENYQLVVVVVETKIMHLLEWNPSQSFSIIFFSAPSPISRFPLPVCITFCFRNASFVLAKSTTITKPKPKVFGAISLHLRPPPYSVGHRKKSREIFKKRTENAFVPFDLLRKPER